MRLLLLSCHWVLACNNVSCRVPPWSAASAVASPGCKWRRQGECRTVATATLDNALPSLLPRSIGLLLCCVQAAVERFRRVSTAYKVLSDRASRADYDAANAFAGMSRRTRMTGAHNFGHRMREAGHRFVRAGPCWLGGWSTARTRGWGRRGEPGTPHFDADAWNASQFAWSEGERMEALRRRMERAAAAAAAGGHSVGAVTVVARARAHTHTRTYACTHAKTHTRTHT